MKGNVVKVVGDKRFGFIRSQNQGEYFFHKDDFSGHWDDLVVDMRTEKEIPVTFDPGESTKGLRAANVRRLDWPNES
jgi:cold shock CspA family protein